MAITRRFYRVWLLSITIACSRLWRSPDLCCVVAKPREHTARESEASEHQHVLNIMM